ncbi:SDR family NAD(P)-dependent oxidoreductase [Streptacidiphilus jiangxiensis]|uniref:Short-chain dehydrogenase n=1 Tax=Streptacidiphilus jiangxiensis TaxID=235985 RepID=A0A1H7VWC9_STRJI|nr:SDR family oxidoreductase [Streptacidiphilus jiangxiensis]SEM13058.1 Short-chain dehydrogenase [Streptacidiphilus jiangxiensis]
MAVAVVTGASRGLGRALSLALVERGWEVVVDGRDADALAQLAEGRPRVHAVPGDVTDAWHRTALVTTAFDLGGLDLLVNNAGVLGGRGLAPVADLELDELRRAFEVNVVAPLGLVQEALPLLRASGGAVLNISSDAAVEAYPQWGGYGATKAALELWSASLAAEEPKLPVWWVDPGEMNTAMYRAADAGAAEQSPLPEEGAVPGLLALLDVRRASGRYTAAGLAQEVGEAGATASAGAEAAR